jgi:arginine repressor
MRNYEYFSKAQEIKSTIYQQAITYTQAKLSKEREEKANKKKNEEGAKDVSAEQSEDDADKLLKQD